MNSKRTKEWQNWSRNESVSAVMNSPGFTQELCDIVANARGSVRVIGSGHSFTPLIAGTATIIDLSRMDLPLVQDETSNSAWLNAASQLGNLSRELSNHNLAFRNLGDINVQTLAGATATATHGTGETLPCLSAEIKAARFISADGEMIETDTNSISGILEATKVSLGLLGIFTQLQMALVPNYNLRRRVSLRPCEDILQNAMNHWKNHRNFEFFLLPASGSGIQISHDVSQDLPDKKPMSLDEAGLMALRFFRNLGRFSPAIRKAGLSLLKSVQSNEDYVGESWQVLSSVRNTRFLEMEYHLPQEQAMDVLRASYNRLETKYPDVYFPVEIRKSAGDTGLISPFQGESRVSVAFHVDPRDGHDHVLKDIERLLYEAGGRPHWGKLHSLTASELAALYPDYNQFCEIRAKLDPKGKFLTPALRKLFT